jgi:hypothetical protein
MNETLRRRCSIHHSGCYLYKIRMWNNQLSPPRDYPVILLPVAPFTLVSEKMHHIICRTCKASILNTFKICPYCGAKHPGEDPWGLLGAHTIKAVILAICFFWITYAVFFGREPSVPPPDFNVIQHTPPPPPSNKLDVAQERMKEKALWAVEILKSSNKAQICGLRSHMWATRIIGRVYASEADTRKKLRAESSNPKEFDAYADALEDWQVSHVQMRPPTDYDCANMIRGLEIDLLVRTDEELKAAYP